MWYARGFQKRKQNNLTWMTTSKNHLQAVSTPQVHVNLNDILSIPASGNRFLEFHAPFTGFWSRAFFFLFSWLGVGLCRNRAKFTLSCFAKLLPSSCTIVNRGVGNTCARISATVTVLQWSSISAGMFHLESSKTIPKLDDGWPESVEEQGLLLSVLRH